jgi:hypothetical protein
MNNIETYPGTLYVKHNSFSSMARVALLALDKELVDETIYDFADRYEGFYDSLITVEKVVANWARSL